MWQDFRPSVRKLSAFVQCEKTGRHLAQIELPRFVPMVRFRKFEWRRTDLKLGKRKNVVNGSVRTPGKDTGVKFDLGLMVPDFLYAANAMMPVRSV